MFAIVLFILSGDSSDPSHRDEMTGNQDDGELEKGLLDAVSGKGEMVMGRKPCCCFAPRNARKVGISMIISLAMNAILVVVAAFYFLVINDSDSPLPPAPPPPYSPNATNATCPFVGAQGEGPKGAPIALTGLGADFISVCWKDAVADKGYSATPYEIHLSDWWTSGALDPVSEPSYSGRGTETKFESLLPGVNYTVELRTKFSNGTVSSFRLNATTLPRGYCGNSDDMNAYYKTKTTMKGQIQSCMESHITSPSAAQSCIEANVGLSPSCAKCWIAEGKCTMSNCLFPCLSPASAKCAACSKLHCFPACVTCSGVPLYAFPL